MANMPLETAPTSEAKNPSGRQENVFLVENTNIDLGALFATIDKKPAPQGESNPATTTKESSKPEPKTEISKETSETVRETVPEKRVMGKRGAILGALAALSILAIGATIGHKFFLSSRPRTPVTKNASVVRQHIAIPHALEKIELIFTAQSKEKEEWLCMNLVVHAARPDAEAILSEIRVALRDSVYGFLIQQRPEKNVRRSWAPIVEKELLTKLQNRFPQAGIVAVELEDLQRI
ncbi:MAG: hypothetical protein WHS46_02045 [Desulfosoma sp.]